MSLRHVGDDRVRAHLRVVMTLLGFVAIAGCERQNAPPSAKNVSKPVAATSPDVPPTDLTAQMPAAQKDDKQNAGEKAAKATIETPAPTAVDASELSVAKTDDATPAESPAPTPERIAILTPGGPLLIDLQLTIASESHTKAFDALVKRVLDAGDSDHDGQPTWKELVADRAYLEKEMPKAPAADSRQMKTLIERYDENRDGRIQTPEAAAWLGRDAGATAKSFAVRSTRAYRPVPRATSQVWHLIDGNNDGRLSREEIEAAPARLLSLDADDDRILVPTEMASLREQLESAGQQRSYVGREANHYAVMHLEPNTEIDRLHYLLSDLYAPQQDLGPDSFSELPALFKKLDTGGDDWLDDKELASLLSVEPHIELNVAFSEPANDKGGTATIEMKSLTPEIAIAAQPSADRAVISLGNTRLILSAHNLATKPNEEQNSGQTAMQNQIRLMVHDQADALFEELDANADGRLGEREIAFCSQSLVDRDRNGDGQLAGDEFPYSMIVAFLLGEQANEQSFYVPPSPAISATSDKPLPPWFTHADLNGDGDVSRREFLGSNEQFSKFDADGDHYMSAAEAASVEIK